MRTKTVVAGGGKAGKVSFPNEGMPSNQIADKQARLLFMVSLAVSFVLTVGGVVWCTAMIYAGATGYQVNIWSILTGVVGLVALFFIARSLVWLSIFGSLMFAQKSNAWEAQQFLCDRAMKLKKLIPGGATTAALLLIQGHISRGEIDETIKIGEQQHSEFGNDPKQLQNMAPMYSTLGLAFHMQGGWRDSITWNDRAVKAFEAVLEQFKAKRGILGKLASLQGGNNEWTKTIHTQLAVTHFNNGTNHFNLRNHRAAKESYRLAVEQANQAPDFPEKADLLRVSKEQLARLKHA